MSQASQNITEFFKCVLRDSGIKLMLEDGPHVISKEQALIVRDIQKQLYDENSVQKFMRGFQLLVRKDENFKKTLLGTQYQNLEREFDMEQESLFRLLLRVPQVQNEITELLLDKLTLIVSEDVPMLRLILMQLRYLPHIKNPEHLTGKLLEIIEIASFPSQLEILEVIPDIFPDSVCNDTARKLVEILENNNELAGAIINCLNALNIDVEIREGIQDNLLVRLQSGISFKQFPVLLDFLLSDATAKNLPVILQKLRDCLGLILDESDDSIKLLIVARLEQSVMLKPMADTWINAISVKNPNEQKPCDFLILFMLHTRCLTRKRGLEILVRKRVKASLFKFTGFEALLGKLPEQLFRDYFNSMLEISLNLLKTSTDGICTEFSSNMIKALYRNKTTTFKQGIIEKLLLVIGQIDRRYTTRLLVIFQDLIPDLSGDIVVLMRLLEVLDRFELADTRIIFEILCELTSADEAFSGFQTEIHMVIRKLLSSCKPAVKSKGIIGAVILSKKLPVKEAIEILNLAKKATKTPELQGLYYDQLSMIVFQTDDLNPDYENWLFENVTEDFQNLYITDTIPEDEEFEARFNLNEDAELDNPLAINIGGLPASKESFIAILPSHFRLVRLLHYRVNNGVLSTIDALLGCGVILPKSDQYDLATINWFRELINAFLLQKNRKLRTKLLHRLGDLIQLEQSCTKQGKYRELDTDLVILLRYPLTGDDEITLTVPQLEFILRDFVAKLQVLTKGSNLGLSQLTLIKPIALIEDCVKILPFLNNHFTHISGVLIADSEYVSSFGLILEALKLIFEWPGFQDAKRLIVLRGLLKALRVKKVPELESVKSLSRELSTRLETQIHNCYSLEHAVNLVKILEALHQFTGWPTKTLLSGAAAAFLDKTWPKSAALNLDYLLMTFLEEKSVKDLCNFVASLDVESLDSLQQLQSINKSNFFILYRNVWLSLAERVRYEIQELPAHKHLLFWKTTALTMQGLMTIAQQQENKNNRIYFLKKCIAILKIFIANGVGILEIELKSKPDEVVEIFKIIQGNTRYLHKLCCYSKLNKDSGLMAYVPQFRLTLETLVYRVKAALVANNCSDAFWMGNLKNRDLDGESIPSQSTMTTNEDESEQNVLPSDEEMNETKSDSDVYD